MCTADINDSRVDGIILVSNDFTQLTGDLSFLKEPLEQQSQVHCHLFVLNGFMQSREG